MGSRRRLIRSPLQSTVTSAAACALVALGCKKPPPPEPAPMPSAQVLPVDRLAPGELPEGKEEAFGLMLPIGLKTARAFTGIVHATSTTLAPEQVANYFRARVTGGSVSSGITETRFVGVHAKTNLERELAIEIRAGAPGVTTCEVILKDMTPPPVEPGLSDDERRRKAGLTPDGRLLDPKHLE